MRPELAAAELGYDAPTENSTDAVGNRDHVAEFLFALAMHGVHLSRLSEEIVLWSSRQFRWIALDDGFATGSSIMPQKKNADIAEITRGRSARLIGDLATMLVALKGLPLAYNRDLIEDKAAARSEEHTSELQSLMRISYAVFCLKKKHKILHKYQTYVTQIVDPTTRSNQ